jgi:phosphatidylinositol alpha-1,6-mannosyltransferase
MLAAWPQVLRRIPAAQLWVAGDGDLRAELEHIAATRGIGDRVRFLGQISEERKQELLGACRCLALPSRGEGFGLVYLEAMRMGRPCVVSTLDAGQEVVAPPLAGLSADPSNPERLADAVSELLTVNHAWHLCSGAARQRYAQQFTAHHFQERLRAALTAATTASEHVRHRRRPAA